MPLQGNKSMYKHINLCYYNLIIAFVLILLLPSTQSTIYPNPACTSTQILNTKTLACQQCPTNKQPNPLQSIPNQCVCKSGYYPTNDGQCSTYFTNSPTACTPNQFINAFNLDGSIITLVTSCTDCAANAYPNLNKTACVPCGTGMTFNIATNKCQCIDPTWTQSIHGCYPQSYYASLGLVLSSSVYFEKLKHSVPGCFYFNSPLQCSQLVNLCVYSLLASTTPECQFFVKSSLTSYLYSDTVNTFRLSALSKSTEIKMKLIYFLPEGNYVKEQDMKLSDIIRCGLSEDADLGVVIGNNIEINCEFNFNNLLSQVSGKNYQAYVYQLLVMGDNGQYFEVNAYINGNSQPVKRFFLEDTFTSSTSINVVTSMNLEFTLSTDGMLTKPSLHLGYTKLSTQPGTGITPTSQRTQNLSYNIQFTSQLSGFWSVILPIFIVINILVLVHAVIKTYIGYLNRKTPFLFFLNFIDLWSLWMFYFLLVVTGYWFIFTKTTPEIYTFISNQSSLYVGFYIVFGLMIAFRFVSVFIDKVDKLKIQVFMINKQRASSLNNSWREIFIINSLAEFSIYRTFSTFWVMLIMLFFVTGLDWEQHSRQVLNTTLDQIQYFHKKNNILLYFISASILLVIVVVFKILRRLVVLWWPYPFQNFVDYCSVTNISLLFMKKRSPESFYIHACLPQRTDVTFKELNHAVRKGLEKNRSISNDLNQKDRLKIYNFYLNRDMEEKFNQMLKRQQDHDHNKHLKYAIGTNASQKQLMTNSKNSFYYRQQFIERRVKPMLEDVVQRDQQRTKTTMQSYFGIPPADLRNERGLNQTQVFVDHNLDILKSVFPNGDEFEELHSIMILYLLWVVVTRSSAIAAFLTYFCDEWIFNYLIESSYKKHLQKMTRVNQGFMM